MSLPFAMWVLYCPNWPCKAIIIAAGAAVAAFAIGIAVGKKLAAKTEVAK